MREMNQVADESPRSGEWQISPFRFVHPCTSTGFRPAQIDLLRATACCAVLARRWSFRPTGLIEAY
jgi:hypothetical protein